MQLKWSDGTVTVEVQRELSSEDFWQRMRAAIRRKLGDAEHIDWESSACVQDCLSNVIEGKVYKIGDIAKLWSCSHEFARRQFVREPGVIKFEGMYLVPECVLERVVRRLMI